MKKDVLIYFISKIVIGLIGIIVLNLYSSMISPEIYGEYSLISSLITAIVSIFIGWIGSSALRYYDEYKNQKIKFFTNVTIYFIIMISVSFITIFICSFIMPSIPVSKYIIYVIFLTIAMSMQEVLEKILRASNKTLIYAMSSIIQSLISIVIFYVLAKFYLLEAESIFLSSIVSRFIFAVISLIAIGFIIKLKKFKLDKNLLKKFISYGIPMIGVWGIGWILHYCDRYIISIYINNYEVGIYDMSCKISENTINLLISSFTLSIFPLLIRDWNTGGKKKIEGKVTEIIKFYNLLILPAIVGLILISDKLYLGIIDKQYMSGKYVIMIISIGTFVNGLNSIINKIWQLNEKTKNIFYIMIVSVITNIVLNIIFIPKYGINAAAATTLASYVISIFITYILVKKDMNIKIEKRSLIKTIISCIIMSAFIIAINHYVTNLFLLFIEILLAVLIYIVSNILLKNITLEDFDFIKGRPTMKSQ